MEKPKFLENILQGKTEQEWLEDRGYMKTRDFGWVKKDRLIKCKELGYIDVYYQKVDGKTERGLELTRKGVESRCIGYIAGDRDTITASWDKENKTEPRVKPEIPRGRVGKNEVHKVKPEQIFQDMLL